MSDDRPRILVAGIGNIFLGDDAFGVEVAQRLLRRPWPSRVRIADFGIRGLDLAYALLEGYDLVVMIDAAPRGHPPGTLYLIEPRVDEAPTGDPAATLDTHAMDPAKVLRLAAAMGGTVERVVIVGCEPAPIADDADMTHGLSAAVTAAIDPAVEMVESLITDVAGASVPRAPST